MTDELSIRIIHLLGFYKIFRLWIVIYLSVNMKDNNNKSRKKKQEQEEEEEEEQEKRKRNEQHRLLEISRPLGASKFEFLLRICPLLPDCPFYWHT